MSALLLSAALLAPPVVDAEAGIDARPRRARPSPVALDYHRRRTTLGLAGMGTLTGWAVANLGGGIYGWLTTRGPTRFFHEGNAAWNTVNLALGITGLVSERRDRRAPVDLATGRARARDDQKVFGINAGLDVVYLSAGAILWSLGRDFGPDRVLGYGRALILQGAFLFVFDVGMMLAHERQLSRAPVTVLPTAMLRPEGGVTAGLVLRLP